MPVKPKNYQPFLHRELIRNYRFQDNDQIKKLFESQGLEVDLPLPSNDPSCAVGVVLERDGKISAALIGRVSMEAHLVIAPDTPGQVRIVQRLKDYAEGVTLSLSERMAQFGFPQITDISLCVPGYFTRLQKMLKDQFGFEFVPEGFIEMYKPLGVVGPPKPPAPSPSPNVESRTERLQSAASQR